MKIEKNTVKSILDAAMAVLLILMYRKNVVSLSFHEFGGLFLCALFVVHLLINARWIKAVSVRFFSKNSSPRIKTLYAVDFLLLACFVLIAVSGILISKKAFPWLNTNSLFWKKVHFSVSAYAVVLIGIHIGLHGAFIKNRCAKIIRIPRTAAKSLGIAAAVLVLAAGAYNGWNSNFKRWILIPFESSATISGTEEDSVLHTGSGQGKGLRLGQGQGAALEQNGQGGFQHAAPPQISWKNGANLLYVYGSIITLFALLTAFFEGLVRNEPEKDKRIQ